MMEQINQLEQWNQILAQIPGGHILQTAEWGLLKQSYGWQLMPQVWRYKNGAPIAAALVMLRKISIGGFGPTLPLMYIPRGPLLDWKDHELRKQVLDDLKKLARQHRAVFLKIDPEVIIGMGTSQTPEDEQNQTGMEILDLLSHSGWQPSRDQVQFPNTVWIDLIPPEEQLLAQMKQKTRYNVRLAERKGVTVRQGTIKDLSLLYDMYAQTAQRDGFVIRTEDYYLKLWQIFLQKDMVVPLIAEVDGEAVAGLMLFFFSGKAWYLHGMSTHQHRKIMPNYLLQWEAIKLARLRDCVIYDLWGAPTTFNESDSMWGVFRFKEGLGGRVIRTIGAWDYIPRPFVFFLYNSLAPRLLDLMRRRSRSQLHRQTGL
jgi:peptidoglycan pentaglycine glycine transferase (the first glycine)